MTTTKKLALAVVLTAAIFLVAALMGVLANTVSDALGIDSIWIGVVLPLAFGVAGAMYGLIRAVSQRTEARK